MDITNVVSAVFSFIGTIIVAFSVIENPGGGYNEVKGKKIFLASILLNKFRLGICIIMLGFLLQLMASFSIFEKSFPNRYDIKMNGDRLYKIDSWTGKVWEFIRSEALGDQWGQL